jgi:NADH:ubiquinone oxidoreductase subunit E
MLQVGETYYEHLTIEKVDELLEQFKQQYAHTNSRYL